MSKNDERFPEVHTIESDDQDDYSLSSTREFLPNELAVLRQEQPLPDSISASDPSGRERHCTTSSSSSKPQSHEPHLLSPLLHYVSSTLNLFPILIAGTVDSDLRFDRLEEKARLCVKINGTEGSSVMAANEQYLLYCPPKRLCIIDDQGAEQLSIERNFNVGDACWSSYLNKFLILSNKLLNSLDLITKQLLLIKQFDQSMSHCTCYVDTFIVSPKDAGYTSYRVQAYNMSPTTNNWTLVRPLNPTASNTLDRHIAAIRFDSNGSRVAVVSWNQLSPFTWLEFQGRYDLNIVQTSTLLRPFLSGSRNWHLLSLPDQMFLLNAVGVERKLLLIDKDRNMRELEILFDSSSENDDFIYRTAFIAGCEKKCLVVRTTHELRFYDL